jgi:hypothetical protein
MPICVPLPVVGKDTLHQALQLETPLREIRNLTWAIIMMADSIDEQQSGAFNDVAGIIYDRVQTVIDQWNELIEHIKNPEGVPEKPSATVLHIVPQLEA